MPAYNHVSAGGKKRGSKRRRRSEQQERFFARQKVLGVLRVECAGDDATLPLDLTPFREQPARGGGDKNATYGAATYDEASDLPKVAEDLAHRLDKGRGAEGMDTGPQARWEEANTALTPRRPASRPQGAVRFIYRDHITMRCMQEVGERFEDVNIRFTGGEENTVSTPGLSFREDPPLQRGGVLVEHRPYAGAGLLAEPPVERRLLSVEAELPPAPEDCPPWTAFLPRRPGLQLTYKETG